MTSCWLSVLIPSKRPEALARYVESLQRTAADFDAVETVVLVDVPGGALMVAKDSNATVIARPPDPDLSMSKLNEACYRASSGSWLLFANDDCLMQTKGWDVKLRRAVETFTDGVVLAYPNDGIFSEQMACFPVVSRRLLDAVRFFPQPYRRYKIDDTLWNLVPPERRIYLRDVHMTHLNDHGTVGHAVGRERIYPIDAEAAAYDLAVWDLEARHRTAMRDTARSLMEAQAWA